MKVNVAVIGGGVAGVQSAIELADLGYSVAIIEKNAYLGGNAARLGKFFPTNDCALCVMASSEVSESTGFRKCFYRSSIEEHPHISILTLCEVLEKVPGADGYKLKVRRNPRYVTEDCISCGKCETVCPGEGDNLFNFGYDKVKAIRLPIFQAIPRRYILDRDLCGDCEGACVKVCPENAINLDDKPEEFELEADSVIVATGFEEFSGYNQARYASDTYKNVITQLQLARLLDPTGPTGGQVISPETGEPVKSLAMILCVGSRNITENPYCSRICCTYSLKHVLMLQELGIDVTVFFMDIRTFGEYEKYYLQAREQGAVFIRGMVATIEQDPQTKKLILHAENTLTSEPMDLSEELVVLTPGLVPSGGTKEVAGILGIETDDFGFVHSEVLATGLQVTSDPGVFVAGTANGPMDVPSSIVQANEASMNVISYLKSKGVQP
ncbi:MAG: FAD-dependent oxidoreductase [Promethearchaeota archaeon]